jgi:hypothetical protein
MPRISQNGLEPREEFLARKAVYVPSEGLKFSVDVGMLELLDKSLDGFQIIYQR